MKRKILNLVLSFVVVFTLAAIVAPVGASKVEAAGLGDGVYGGYASYDQTQYDVAFVAITPLGGAGYFPGSDATGDGSVQMPWRTITYAENQLPFADGPNNPDGIDEPDLIVVGPSDPLHYGGAVYEENIYIEYPVTIVSWYGAELTVVDVFSQNVVPPYVIEIVASDVIIDGLTLTGTTGGVFAHPDGVIDPKGVYPPPPPPPEIFLVNVKVLNSVIFLETPNSDSAGIVMTDVKYAVVDGDTISVGVGGEGDLGVLGMVDYSTGIGMVNCFNAQITNNEIDVKGSVVAVGIDMENCPKSLVGWLPAPFNSAGPNDIEVLAKGDVLAFGIKVEGSDLIDIVYNLVGVKADGNGWAVAYGIKVKDSDRSDVNNNNVFVDVCLVGQEGGFMMGKGIQLKECDESNVLQNWVEVTGVGNVNNTVALPVAGDADVQEDLADLVPVLNQSLGVTQVINFAGGAGLFVGILVKYSECVKVDSNNVIVNLDLGTVAGVQEFKAASGAVGVAAGIVGICADKIIVTCNWVDVDSKVNTWAMALPLPPPEDDLEPEEIALSGGLSVALGITLFDSEKGLVQGNTVAADADVATTVLSVSVALPFTTETGSALSVLDSKILSAISEQAAETAESEAVGVQVDGDLSLGGGGGLAAGIGILVICSNGTAVNGNTVGATGDASAWVQSVENSLPLLLDWAVGLGGTLGLGIGIAVIDCDSMEVSGNCITSAGTATATVGALHDVLPPPPDDDGVDAQNAAAVGGGAGVGIGILLVDIDFNEMVDSAEPPQEEGWIAKKTVVAGNCVTTTGTADPIYVNAIDLVPGDESYAIGGGLGLALGIAACGCPCIVIAENCVTANALATADICAVATDTFDPYSIGDATGIGVGIIVVDCFKASILNNEATGTGMANGEIGATELLPPPPLALADSAALGGSLGLGIGIAVIYSPCSLVSGNSVANGVGDAQTTVIAISFVPLHEADALALAAGIGKGIAVLCSPSTDIVRCNTAAGAGTARVCATAIADFNYDKALGLAASFDILVKLDYYGNFGEADLDAEGYHHFFKCGVVNYNSMIDVNPLGVNQGPVLVMDAGLLKIGHPKLDATLNWWSHATGPSGFGPGQGEAVLWTGKPVCFTPWLYVCHCTVLEDQTGYFGFYIPMCKGLNTFSTPIALEQTVVPSRSWGNIATNSGLVADPNPHVKFILGWNDATETWFSVGASDNIDPLYGYYIYFFAPGENIILMVNSSMDHPFAMPTRTLSAGWNLIGPNPLFGDPCMPADEVLTSVKQTPAGLPGYTQAISPIVQCQPAWTFVPDMWHAPDMLSGRGYWVWMENSDILVGFGFSPLPAGP